MEFIFEGLCDLIRAYSFKRKYPFAETNALADAKIEDAKERLKRCVSEDIFVILEEVSYSIAPDVGLENSRAVLAEVLECIPEYKPFKVAITKQTEVLASSPEEALELVKSQSQKKKPEFKFSINKKILSYSKN